MLTPEDEPVSPRGYFPTDPPRESTVLTVGELIDDRISHSPDAIAIRFDNHRVTYAELGERVTQYAAAMSSYLPASGFIGVILEHSMDLIPVLLAVWKAGAAYVPLDPDIPAARLEFMIRDSGVSAIVTSRRWLPRLPPNPPPVVCVEDLASQSSGSTKVSTRVVPNGRMPAYLIYTSGTSGRPKGVLVSHDSFANCLQSMRHTPGISHTDVLLALTAISFDIAGLELFLPLIAGATVTMIPRGRLRDIDYLLPLLESGDVTYVQATPSTWRLMLLSGWRGNPQITVLVGGEPLYKSLAAKLVTHSRAVWNMYGPTETTIWSTICRVTSDELQNCRDEAALPIGSPIDNTRIFLFDDFGKECPIGVEGEICIGGLGLAIGYKEQPQLTQEKFVCSSALNWERIYKTGDIGRLRTDGKLEYIGRRDEQLKISGVRVELMEIEAVLNQQPDVSEAAVVVEQAKLREPRIVAFAVPKGVTIEGATGAISTQITDHIALWQGIWDQAHGQPSPSTDASLNYSGYTSSYTGRLFGEVEIREWLSEVSSRVRELHPKRILEIGCGSGMLLEALVKDVDLYVATDISPAAIEHLRRRLDELPSTAPRVQLLCRPAHDTSDLRPCFDTVILNSVVQYFPTLEYLLLVLKKVAAVLEPGGQIFLGDVRHFNLIETFHASLELRKAVPSLSLGDLRYRAIRSGREEGELLIDPNILWMIKAQWPTLSVIDVIPRKTANINELSKYRCDVVLRSGVLSSMVFSPSWIDGDVGLPPIAEIRHTLIFDRPPVLAIRRVPNSVLLEDVILLDTLANHPELTVGEYRSRQPLTSRTDSAWSPQQCDSFGQQSGYRTHLSWADTDQRGRFDVVWVRDDVFCGIRPEFAHSMPGDNKLPCSTNPLFSRLARLFVPQLRRRLRSWLPNYMMPDTITLVPELPRTVSGKLDKQRLLATAGREAPVVELCEATPVTSVEELITQVWQKYLRSDAISVNSRFFDLGGTSLQLTMVYSELQLRFSSLRMVDLYRYATVRALAQFITGRSPPAEIPSTPLRPSRGSQWRAQQ